MASVIGAKLSEIVLTTIQARAYNGSRHRFRSGGRGPFRDATDRRLAQALLACAAVSSGFAVRGCRGHPEFGGSVARWRRCPICSMRRASSRLFPGQDRRGRGPSPASNVTVVRSYRLAALAVAHVADSAVLARAQWLRFRARDRARRCRVRVHAVSHRPSRIGTGSCHEKAALHSANEQLVGVEVPLAARARPSSRG